MNPQRTLGAGAALVLLAVALTGCSEEDERAGADPGSRIAQQGGPLQMPAESGGVGIFAPAGAHSSWSGSFGGLPLCTDPAGTSVRIVGVEVLDTTGVVKNLEAFVARRDPGTGGDLLYLSAQGRAPAFAEPYASRGDRKAPFSYESLDEPLTVDGACGDGRDAANLVLTFDTNTDGGLVKSWELLYDSDGERYTTGPVPWQMWLCGDSLGRRQACT